MAAWRRLLGLLLAGCSSFEAAPATPADGGGPPPPDAGADGGSDANPAAGGCPKPLPSTMVCWDFDDGALPGGMQKNGAFALDDRMPYSPPHALLATTEPLVSGTEGWAALVQTFAFAGAPRSVTLDQRVRAPSEDVVEIGEIKVQGKIAGDYYTAHFKLDHGSLEVIEQTYNANSIVDGADMPHQLKSVVLDTWIHLVMRVDLIDFPGTTATRHIVVTVDDGPPSVDSTDGQGLDTLTEPDQLLVYAGLSYVGAYGGGPEAARQVGVDDVRISWAP